VTLPRTTTIAALLARYRGFAIDAYGVLVDAGRALPGARELIAALDHAGTPYVIATNDASRSPATSARRFAGVGLPIPADRVVTSGQLLAGHRGLRGARTCVLGPADSFEYAAAAGAIAIAPAAGMEIDAIAVCDDDGFDFLRGSEQALSAAIRALDAGRPLALVLPNPDLVYPKAPGELGFTAGTIALMIEAALARRFPATAPRFERLGKPERHLFDRAVERLGVARTDVVVIGDQLETDIAGAVAAGVDSALVEGVSRWTPAAAIAPTWLLETLG
jgi:ribonucleotide monophosphatase NagD (HAD superfamily)